MTAVPSRSRRLLDIRQCPTLVIEAPFSVFARKANAYSLYSNSSSGSRQNWMASPVGPARQSRPTRLTIELGSHLLAAEGGFLHGLFQLPDVLGRQLRPVDLDRQLVELGCQRERRLVVLVVHAGERVRADVEGFVPLQDHRQRFLHPLGRDLFAIHLQRASAWLAEAAEVVERERPGTDALVL